MRTRDFSGMKGIIRFLKSKEGNMLNPVIEIDKILTQEMELYGRIYALEEKKSAAITEKDGRKLEHLCREQEALLEHIAKLENARIESINRYAEINHLDDLPREATLRDITGFMDEDSSRRLLSRGIELRKLLTRLKNLNEVNHGMIRDNLDFFDILLSGLRDAAGPSAEYNAEGRDRKPSAGSLLFNKTV